MLRLTKKNTNETLGIDELGYEPVPTNKYCLNERELGSTSSTKATSLLA